MTLESRVVYMEGIPIGEIEEITLEPDGETRQEARRMHEAMHIEGTIRFKPHWIFRAMLARYHREARIYRRCMGRKRRV